MLNKNGIFRGKQGYNDIGTLINVMTHETTHLSQFQLVGAARSGAKLSEPFSSQANLLAVGDEYSKRGGIARGSGDPNYKLSAHEAQAFHMGDSVEKDLEPEFSPTKRAASRSKRPAGRTGFLRRIQS